MLIPFIFFIFLQIIKISGNVSEEDFNTLTKHFIETLRIDPFLNGESKSGELSKTSKEFIDKHIERYSQLVLTSKEREFSRSKRSLDELEKEGELSDYVTDISNYGDISVTASSDIVLFYQNTQLYSASLEKTGNSSTFNLLKVSKYAENNFSSVTERVIENGARVAAYSLKKFTIIVVAENTTELNYTNIYEFNSDDELYVIQRLEESGHKDVNIWEDNGNVFMSLVGFMANSPVSSSRLYKWRGRHFDVLQNVSDMGVARITPFRVDDIGFIAVARNMPKQGEGNIYSDILKYSVENEKYELFRRILTYACEDIKYFEIDTEDANGESREKFLIVANMYKIDTNGVINYTTSSIIYKYDKDYFIPIQVLTLTGVKQWEVIKNQDGDVLLMGLTIEGLRAFVYDGWRFAQTKIRFGGNLRNRNTKDFKVMHSYSIDRKNILVAPRQNPTQTDSLLLEISFTSNNKYKQVHDKILKWCQETMTKISEKNEDVLGRIHRGDVEEELESESLTEATDSEKLTSSINHFNSKLLNASHLLKKSLQSSEHHVIEKDLTAHHVHINSTGKLDRIDVQNINSNDIRFLLDNVLDINNGFNINSNVKFDRLFVEEDLQPKIINGHQSSTIVYKNKDNVFKNLEITGSGIFKDDLSVGKINGIQFDVNNILLKNRDQNLRNFNVRKVRADKIEAKTVNGRPVLSSKDTKDKNSNKGKLNSVKVLRKKNLIVAGFLNDVNVPTLEKYALRKSGKQDITGKTYYFDRVESELLDTDRLSDTHVPEDLIVINTGNYVVPKSLFLENSIIVNNLTVLKHLDSISVTHDGSLDLLLRNKSAQQHVTGQKTIRNVELLNPINLRGKLKGEAFENLNPLKKITSNITINHDVKISGNVQVETSLNSSNIISSSNSQKNKLESISRVVQHGIKLTDKNVNNPVIFLEHLNVAKVQADNINDIEVENLVISGAKNPQIITGWKTFNSDLEITGNTNVKNINNINTKEFESNILTLDGNQTITGNHEIDTVNILGSLQTNKTKFGTKPWKTVLTSVGNQTINAMKIDSFTANSTAAKHIKIKGKINNINFHELIHDAVLKNTSSVIKGSKTFNNLNINKLKNNFNLKEKLDRITSKNLLADKLENLVNITAAKLYFANNLNGVNQSELRNIALNNGTDKIVMEESYQFEEIVIYGDVFLESNRINNIDLDEIEENSVKVDEPQEFKNAEFGKIFAPVGVTHHGQIENLDLNNIVENNKNGSQNVLDKLDFLQGVIVNGTVNIKGKLNGLDTNNLCTVITNQPNKILTIEGNVVFAKGPHISHFNNNNASEFKSNVWFTDNPVKIQSKVKFLGNVTIRKEINLKGLLNGIDVTYLRDNYLSKTKDQKIFANLNFSAGAIFLKDITTANITVGKRINEINLTEFIRTALLHRPQLFEDLVYFDELTVEDLEGNYLVNKLNLDSEVMRYDRTNLITGPKSFENLDVDDLRANHEGALVQEVDVGQWLETAVLSEGNYKIAATKTFVDLRVDESTNIIGRLNNLRINNETVMLKNSKQNITGKKEFNVKQHGVNFKALKVKGLFNGENYVNVVNNQANKLENNKLDYPVLLENEIAAPNVNFKGKYHGINVLNLLKNISTIRTLSHIKEKYQSLMDMANDVERSLKNQAYYLDYFKTVLPTFEATDLFHLNCSSSDSKILSFKNESNRNIMQLLRWDNNQEVFNQCCPEKKGRYPTYVDKIVFRGIDAVYVEHRKEFKIDDNTHTGELLICKNNTIIQFEEFLTKGTIQVISLQVKSSSFLIFLDFEFNVDILRSESNQSSYSLQQTIRNDHEIAASAVVVNDVPYLIIIHKEVENKTEIWRMSENKFEKITTYFEGEPISVSTISSRVGVFLAVAYRQSPKTQDNGKIVIRKFDESSGTFVIFQKLKIKAPTQILFSKLPSEEIALYITTQTPSEHFIAYLYEGVFGFARKIGSSTIPKAAHIREITFENEHFVVVKHEEDMTVLHGVFKGKRFDNL